MRLVAVTLNAPDDWNDHIRLFEYGFSLLSEQTLPGVSVQADVVGGTAPAVPLSSKAVRVFLTAEESEDVETEILCPPFLYAPVSRGDAVGTVRYRVGDAVLSETPLCAAESVPYAQAPPNPGGKPPGTLFPDFSEPSSSMLQHADGVLPDLALKIGSRRFGGRYSGIFRLRISDCNEK